jgi:hypothetical protein
MGSRSEGHGRESSETDTGGHPHEKAAEELSQRAGETVNRHYDSTKEAYHHAPEQVTSGDGGEDGSSGDGDDVQDR